MKHVIDWSKAPEGATHKDSGVFGLWYKFDFQRNTAAYWVEREAKWRDSGPATAYNDGSLDSMTARPEQIAAEDRERVIAAMLATVNPAPWELPRYRLFAERLYDANYRKFEIADGEA